MLNSNSVSAKLKYLKYYAKVLLQNWSRNVDSYAQHGEDLLVERLLGKVSSFVDIGANDGVLFSNTYKFAKGGASGLCFEPSVFAYRKLQFNHLFHPKVKCFRKAVSDRIGLISFLESGYEATLSHVCNKENGKLSHKVKATTLGEIFNRYPRFIDVDLFSVDVEGHEVEVFAGLVDRSIKARLVIVETDKSDPKELLQLPALREHRPRFYNGINLILLHQSEKLVEIDLPKNFHKF